MKDIAKLFTPMSEKMTPYSPIEPPDLIAERLGIKPEEVIKLDANENPFGTSSFVMEAIAKQKYYSIYPDPAQTRLRQSIAQYAGFEPEKIVAGTGSDELIDLLCRLFLDPGDKVLGFTPTFSYYDHVVGLNRGQYLCLPREENFSISLKTAQKADLDGVKLVILCSPNNPTGNLLEEEVLDYFLSKNVVVVVDEAYFEFAGRSFDYKIDEHENLVLLRTFSKCFALAGLRVGYGIMSDKIANRLMRIKPPYSVNMAAEAALKACLDNLDYYRQQVGEIVKLKEMTLWEMDKIKGLKVYPSFSNFILSRSEKIPVEEIRQKLEEKGILIRCYKLKELSDCFRVSIGTEEQIRKFLKVLKNLLED